MTTMIYTSNTQRTYSRTCGCEYMRDGSCAYTLVVPLGGLSEGACQTANQPESNQSNDEIQQLRQNLTDIAQNSEQNTRILAQLQSLMLNMQSTENTSLQSNINMSLTLVLNAINVLTTSVQSVQEQSQRSEQRLDEIEQRQTSIQTPEGCRTKGLLISGRSVNSSEGGAGRYLDNDQLHSSSIYNEEHGKLKSRIFTTESPAAWCPGKCYINVIMSML